MSNEQLQRYSRHVYFNEDDQDYIALCSEFRHLSAFGDTPEEALRELNEVLEAALEIHAEEGWPIPRPEAPPEPEGLPSGRFVTRLPKTLHAQLVRQARFEGVSQNQLVISYVAAGLGAARHGAPTVVDNVDVEVWSQYFTPGYRLSAQNVRFHVWAQTVQHPKHAALSYHPKTQGTSVFALAGA